MNRQSDIFTKNLKNLQEKSAPLAARMRPRNLDEFVGQSHIIGPGRLLRRAIQADQLSSLLFWGPPGSGKTTLAAIIANTTRSYFHSINAVLAGVKEIREAIAEAQERLKLNGQRTILFVDEVHRFNKAQQDALLPHVESGLLILIGATTENPYFEVIKALVSRSRIFQLRKLDENDIQQLLLRTIADKDRGFGSRKLVIHKQALEHLAAMANGDARAALNALELAVETTEPDAAGSIVIDLAVAEESIQRRAVLYDKDGDAHYDTISAFIKSLRGSDPDAALYWLARMIYAGEDPRFIFRRMLIFAAEDVGLADSSALQLVTSAAQAFEYVGLPEGQFHLAEACVYLATAPKSNSVLAYFEALQAVQKETSDETPNHLKDASRDREGFGHGAGYKYPHAYKDHWIAQQYLPDKLLGHYFYRPSTQGAECILGAQLTKLREAQAAALAERERDQPIDTATSGPAKKEYWNFWLDRTVALSGDRLNAIRDRLMTKATLARHHLVVIPQAETGFLVWEALRRLPEGGVIAIESDQNNLDELSYLSTQLPDLHRPYIVHAQSDRLPLKPHLVDRVIAKDLLVFHPDRSSIISQFRDVLNDQGRVCLFESLPAQSPPLHRILDCSSLPEALIAGLDLAHEQLLASGLPQYTLIETSIESAFHASGFQTVSLERFTENRSFAFTPQIARTWLDRKLPNGLTLRQLLGKCLDENLITLYQNWLQRRASMEAIGYPITAVFILAAI